MNCHKCGKETSIMTRKYPDNRNRYTIYCSNFDCKSVLNITGRSKKEVVLVWKLLQGASK